MKSNGVVIFSNPEKSRATREIPRLQKWLKDHGLAALSISQIKRASLVVTLGGDGTILAVAPVAAQAGVPVLGVNVGRLGFMTAVEIGSLYSALETWRQGKATVSERMMLEVYAPRVRKPLTALNDAVIRIGATTRVTSISATISRQPLGLFTGDGVIVATPTGSTAYSLAAQGPVVHPEIEALILTPICPHSFARRTVVFPASQMVELKLQDPSVRNEVQLCLDGQRVFVMRPGDRVRVRRSRYKLQLLRDPHVSFFELLREKLSWGKR